MCSFSFTVVDICCFSLSFQKLNLISMGSDYWSHKTNNLNLGLWEDVILIFIIFSHFMHQNYSFEKTISPIITDKSNC